MTQTSWRKVLVTPARPVSRVPALRHALGDRGGSYSIRRPPRAQPYDRAQLGVVHQDEHGGVADLPHEVPPPDLPRAVGERAVGLRLAEVEEADLAMAHFAASGELDEEVGAVDEPVRAEPP